MYIEYPLFVYMENIIDNNPSGKMALTPDSLRYLNETRKWTLFLSIIGFIVIGFMLIAFFGMQSMLTQSNIYSEIPVPPIVFSIIFLMFALLYVYPVYSLFMYSKLSKEAIETHSENTFQQAFKHHRNLFKFMGIFMIIILSIYALIFLIAMLAALGG